MTTKILCAVLAALAVVSVNSFEFKMTAAEAYQTPWKLDKSAGSVENLEFALLKMETRRQTLGLKSHRAKDTASGVDTNAEGALGAILGFAYGL